MIPTAHFRHLNSSPLSLVLALCLLMSGTGSTLAVTPSPVDDRLVEGTVLPDPHSEVDAPPDSSRVDDEEIPAPDPGGYLDDGEAADPDLVLESSLEELLEAYLHQIDRLQTLSDTYDHGLAESYSGLAQLLQAQGDHESAIDTYLQAMHIERVNNGIYSVSQEPMLRGMIDSHLAMGDMDSVSGQFEQLLWLYSKGYGESDPRLIPLVAEISEWHLQAYANNPNRRGISHLVRSHTLVASVVERFNQPVAGGTLTMVPLLRNLVVTNFYLADHQRRYPVGSREGFSMRASMAGMPEPLTQDEVLMVNSYHNGRRAQERIVATVLADPAATTLDRVTALEDLGDWYLLFGRADSAQRAYRQAWQLAAEDPDTARHLDDLFGSPRLITLQPTGVKAAPATLEDNDQNIRITARLAIGPRGTVRGSEIVGLPAEEADSVSSWATREVRRLRFRPRLVDGNMTGSDGFDVALVLRQE